jgi:hypothetical protein
MSLTLPLRTTAVILLGTVAIGIPRVGLSDVAPPDAVYEKAEDEACPDASELTLEDVTVNDYGCTVTGLDELYFEEATRCYYNVVAECGGGGCSG